MRSFGRGPHHRHDFLGLLCALVFLALTLTLTFQARQAAAGVGHDWSTVLDSRHFQPVGNLSCRSLLPLALSGSDISVVSMP